MRTLRNKKGTNTPPPPRKKKKKHRPRASQATYISAGKRVITVYGLVRERRSGGKNFMIKMLKVFSIQWRDGSFTENNHTNFSGQKMYNEGPRCRFFDNKQKNLWASYLNRIGPVLNKTPF